MLVTWSKSHVVLTMETSHCKFSSSLLSLVSNDLIWQPHLGVKQFYGWKLLAICHHTEKPCDHSYCNSGDKIFFICHMTSPKHMFKQLCEFMGRSPPWWFTTLPCLVAIGLIEVESHVIDTSENHVIEVSSIFMSGSSSWYVTTLPSFVAIVLQ